MADLKQTAEVLGWLSSLYPRYTLMKDTARAYQVIVGDIDSELLRAAAIQIASTSKWFPAASELRAAALEITQRAAGVPSPAEAWGEVMAQLRAVGSWGKPEFSTDLVLKAVDALGGWTSLCQSDNTVADRAHFLRIYESLLQRRQGDQLMLPQVREAARRQLLITEDTCR